VCVCGCVCVCASGACRMVKSTWQSTRLFVGCDDGLALPVARSPLFWRAGAARCGEVGVSASPASLCSCSAACLRRRPRPLCGPHVCGVRHACRSGARRRIAAQEIARVMRVSSVFIVRARVRLFNSVGTVAARAMEAAVWAANETKSA
jgi:hypothetical protein